MEINGWKNRVSKEQRPSWNNSVIFLKHFPLLTSSRKPSDKSYSILREAFKRVCKRSFYQRKVKINRIHSCEKKRDLTCLHAAFIEFLKSLLRICTLGDMSLNHDTTMYWPWYSHRWDKVLKNGPSESRPKLFTLLSWFFLHSIVIYVQFKCTYLHQSESSLRSHLSFFIILL